MCIFFTQQKYELPRRWFCDVRPLPIVIDGIIPDEELVDATTTEQTADVTDKNVDALLAALDEALP